MRESEVAIQFSSFLPNLLLCLHVSIACPAPSTTPKSVFLCFPFCLLLLLCFLLLSVLPQLISAALRSLHLVCSPSSPLSQWSSFDVPVLFSGVILGEGNGASCSSVPLLQLIPSTPPPHTLPSAPCLGGGRMVCRANNRTYLPTPPPPRVHSCVILLFFFCFRPVVHIGSSPLFTCTHTYTLTPTPLVRQYHPAASADSLSRWQRALAQCLCEALPCLGQIVTFFPSAFSDHCPASSCWSILFSTVPC